MIKKCKHKSTAAASPIRNASVWCPDCKKWVVLQEARDE